MAQKFIIYNIVKKYIYIIRKAKLIKKSVPNIKKFK